MNKKQVREQIEGIIAYVTECELNFWEDDIVDMRNAVNALENNQPISNDIVISLQYIQEHIQNCWMSKNEDDISKNDILALQTLIDHAKKF